MTAMLARHGHAALLIALCVVAIGLLAANLAHAAVFVVLAAIALALLGPVVRAIIGAPR